MVSSKANELHTQNDGKAPKRYHFELSRMRLAFYSCGLVLSLCWMFAFGVLIGRGIPLVEIDDASIKAEIYRLLGLGKVMSPPPENIAETWDEEKVLKSLSYYKNLTQRDASAALTAIQQGMDEAESEAAPPTAASAAPPSKASIKELPVQTSNQKAKSPSPPSTSQAQPREQVAPDPEKPAPAPPARDVGRASNTGEQFSLLVCSLRDADSAQRLIEQLKSKGYAPRIEALDLQAGGRWNRVLIGSFKNREEALRFAADFNKKERMEGLVIRESQ